MAEVLSQNEIEALLAAMTTVEEAAPNPAVEERMAAKSGGGGAATSMLRPADGKVFRSLAKRRRYAAGQAMGDPRFTTGNFVSYEPYDFRRPDKLSKENLRSLQLIHETFSTHFGSSLSGYLRAQVQIEVVSVEQVPYDEYMRSISASLLNVLDVKPLAGQCIFEIDFGTLFSMLDRLLGGTGAAGKVMRDLTDIERVLSSNIVELALNDMKSAWTHIHPVEFDIATTETSSQFVQIVPGNDTVVLILFEVRMGEHQGAMSLCIPYLLIKPILGKLSAQRWLASQAKRSSAAYAEQMAQRLRTTRVPCIAHLGRTTMTVADLAGLQVGQVITMEVPPESLESGEPGRIGTVNLLIGGQVKFRGKTGLRGKNLAVQIEQVVVPTPELISNKELT